MRITAGLIAVVAATTIQARADDVNEVPAYDQFLVIPLRVHVMTSKTLELANCPITDEELAKLVPRINQIWHKAGIHFGLESVVRDEATQVDRFQILAELNNGQQDGYGHFAYLLPHANPRFDGLNVYVFNEPKFNSVYLSAADAVLVRHQPELRTVKGGSDHPLSRVSARGLGTALGLTLRQDDSGLLSAATNGTGLAEEEVSRARLVAPSIPGELGVVDVAKEAAIASKKGDIARVRMLWTWLSEIPGDGAAEAKKRLAALPAVKP